MSNLITHEDARLVKIISRVAALVAIAIAVLPPIGYLALSWQTIIATAECAKVCRKNGLTDKWSAMKAIILIKMNTGDLREALRDLKRLRSVAEAHLTFGPYDAIAIVHTDDLKALGRIVARGGDSASRYRVSICNVRRVSRSAAENHFFYSLPSQIMPLRRLGFEGVTARDAPAVTDNTRLNLPIPICDS